MQQFEEQVEALLAVEPYGTAPQEKHRVLLQILKEELECACQGHEGYRNYVQHWPVDFRAAKRISDLPYLPVGLLKADPPLALVPAHELKRTLTSSATTSQVPSRVALDAATARRMTKGVVSIVRNFIGPSRRPYLVVDTPANMENRSTLGARGAAIRSLQPFASQTTHCLSVTAAGDMALQRQELEKFATAYRESEVLVYGFTYILWKYLTQPLLEEGVCLGLPNARVLHSGGWKRLQEEAVDKATFNRKVAKVFGCTPDRIVDFYGMVETVGVIFPDCPEGNKHAPLFGEVIVRDPLTLKPVEEGECGVVQVCSILPTSFPGHLLLTEDRAEVVAYDGCACGRRGISFRFAGRIPKAEVRGCGNLQVSRAAAG